METSDILIFHQQNTDYDISTHLTRLSTQTNTALPVEEEKILLKELAEFEMGRFLLSNKGLNGYWTAYAILHGIKKTNLSPLEYWVLHHAPVLKATRERFYIFQDQIQKYLKNHSNMASIPCGLMDDLLTLDYSDVVDAHIIGIDLDQESLLLAQKNSDNFSHHPAKISFLKRNAWDLGVTETYDLITSNGLNIYEPDDIKVTALYREFWKALIPGGIFITSFLTPPPLLSPESTWKNFNPQDAQKQRALFADIIQAAWQVFRTEAQVRKHLKAAGFNVIDVIYDSQGMFPTVVAVK